MFFGKIIHGKGLFVGVAGGIYVTLNVMGVWVSLIHIISTLLSWLNNAGIWSSFQHLLLRVFLKLSTTLLPPWKQRKDLVQA